MVNQMLGSNGTPTPRLPTEVAEWGVKVGRGWRKEAPTAVRETFSRHEGHGKQFVFAYEAGAHLTEGDSFGDLMFYGKLQEHEVINYFLSYLDFSLGKLESPADDGISLIFVNFNPSITTLPLSRQDNGTTEAFSLIGGLREFFRHVKGSLRGEGVWSTCEWVMMSCSRVG
jgi:hypothetical protein